MEKTVAGWSVPGHTTGYNPTLANQYLKQAYAEKGLSANTRITCILLVDYYDYQWSDAAYWLEDQLEQVFGGLVDVRIQWFYNDVRTAKQIYAWDLSPNLWTRSLSRTYPHQSMYYYISAYEGHPNTFTSARFDAQFARCEQLKNGSYDTLLAETYQLEMIYLEQVIHCPVSQTSRCWLMNENIPLRAKTYSPGFGWGEIFGKGTN